MSNVLLVCALLLSISVSGLSPGCADQPSFDITWSPARLSTAITQGGSWEGSASFTSTTDLDAVTVVVDSELMPFVSVYPDSPVTVAADAPSVLQISISIPEDTTVDTVHEGAVSLKVSNQVRGQALEMRIYVAAPLDTVTEESYNATLALEVEAGQLYWDNEEEIGTEQAKQVALEFLSQQDEVFDAGISEGGSIWVVYKDGIHALISTSPPGAWGADYFGYGTEASCEVMASSESHVTTLGVLDSSCYAYGSQASDAVTASSGTYVTPGNKKAILLWPFCSDPSMQPTDPEWTLGGLMEQLSNSLAAIGYEVTSVKDAAVTVDRLKSMYSYGVVDLLAHGEVFSNTVVIVTGEEATVGSTWTHRDDLRHHRLLRRTASPARYLGVWCHWAIRPPFVTHYAAEPYRNSLIVANCCKSLSNLSMADAFLGAGAHVYVGWSESTHVAIQPSLYPLLTQGLTIANAYQELLREDKHICPTTGARLLYYPSGNGNLRLIHLGEPHGQISILNVIPNSNLQRGTETAFAVEVEYSYGDLDEAILYVGFNNGDAVGIYVIHGEQRVQESEGVHTFHVTAETKDWGEEGDFAAYANVSEYPHPESWSPLDSDVYPLNFEEDDPVEPEYTPMVAAGSYHTVGLLRFDDTVVAAGLEVELAKWNLIDAVP